MQGDFLATEELSHRGLGSKETENETFSSVAVSLKTTIGTLSNDDGSERENGEFALFQTSLLLFQLL